MTRAETARRPPGPDRPKGGPPMPGAMLLRRGRVHEICGPARRTLALMQAGMSTGGGFGMRDPAGAGGSRGIEDTAGAPPVIWIAPAWGTERLHAPGLARLVDPGRLVFVACPRAEDVLWCAEEALREMAAAGIRATVVAECTAPPGLTPVRRLHLAAGGLETGGLGTGGLNVGGLNVGGAAGGAVATAGPGAPLGLLLTAGEGGAAGVESRWHIAPAHAPGRSAWRLERRRARGAGPAAWRLVAAPGRLWLEPATDDAPPPTEHAGTARAG